uniref:Uncharacterized protein n=1 Tax=Arundo donax TaxID=35708 RepID=A0A0A9CNI9_ARUDO
MVQEGPDPVPMVQEGASFSSEPSLRPPTMPMSARFTFFGPVMFRSINPRLKESAHIPDLT